MAEEEQKKAENFAKEAKELAAAKENVLKEDEVVLSEPNQKSVLYG